MTAGYSAQLEAERARSKALELERELKVARDRAVAFTKGAEGEELTAEALGALSGHGWHLLHDRQVPGLGGNVDHVAVGPGGVVVLNAKHWTGPVFKDGVLWAGRRNCVSSLERLEKERFTISVLVREVLPELMASSALVFTKGFRGDPGGTTTLTLETLREHFLDLPAALSNSEVERVFSHLLTRTYAAGVKVDAVTEADFAQEAKVRGMGSAIELDERYTRIYLKEWSKGSLRRVYATDAKGDKLGWRDQANGAVTLEKGCSAPHTTKAVLAVGSAKALGKVEVPEMAMGSKLGKRILMAIAGVNRSVLACWHWHGAGKNRLYVHLLDHKAKPLALGYVDLDTGEVSVNKEVTGRNSSSEHLLRYAWIGAR